MLQKGFLKPRNTEERARSEKQRRMLLGAGIVMVFGGLLGMFAGMSAGKLPIVAAALLAIGLFIIASGMWMNFFTQFRKRQDDRNVE